MLLITRRESALSAATSAPHTLANPEASAFTLAIGSELHVGRLQIPMYDALLMRVTPILPLPSKPVIS